MATCPNCGAKGLFLTLNGEGKCSKCYKGQNGKRSKKIDVHMREHRMAIFNREKYAPVFQRHYTNLEKIEQMYSVLYNQRIFEGPQMDKCISLCLEDIAIAEAVREGDLACGGEQPPCYGSFSRLAIIYEKRHEYDKAIEVCVRSIKLGYTGDNSKGGMIGRLSRLMRKAGIQISPEELLKLNERND